MKTYSFKKEYIKQCREYTKPLQHSACVYNEIFVICLAYPVLIYYYWEKLALVLCTDISEVILLAQFFLFKGGKTVT